MSLNEKAVVITTPAWLHGDGVGHDIEGMAKALLDAGWNVHVYSPYYYASPYESWRMDFDTTRKLLQNPETVLIHHHSIGCAETESLLQEAKARVRIMRYHNVTPPEFFEGYNDEWVKNCRNGRLATMNVVRHCTHFSVPSLYDGRDIVHAGVPAEKIAYLPYFHKLSDFDQTLPDQTVLKRLEEDKRFHVLFLGRRVNNKGHLHLIRTVATYIGEYGNDIVLHMVGAADPSLAKYDDEIQAEIQKFGVEKNVILYDKLSFAGIVAFYKGCDVFLCMSEHEGFCIPVIEAEYCGLPVVAYYRRGVPEALGPTQPWFTSLNYIDYARKLHEIRSSPDLANELSKAAADSVRQRFPIKAIRSRFLKWISDIAGASEKNTESGRMRHRIAFVVQRYGQDVSGGAEAFARMYAERLAEFYDIDVITTTSKTLDWDSTLQIYDVSDDSNPQVIRFQPESPRDWLKFSSACEASSNGRMSFADWLLVAGPKSPQMADFLQVNAESYELIINWTYLYSNALYVANLAGRVPLLCVPFFHDEPWLYIPGHNEVARCFDGYVYQTDAEKSLAEKVGEIDNKPSIILGAGIQETVADQVRDTDTSSPIDGPYIVYVGRVEKAKGVQELLDFFIRFKQQHRDSSLKLVIVGRAFDCELPEHPDVVLPGFVSEFEKFRLIKHARALINPSQYESFSLVLIESWAMSRPVVVTHRCPATSGQVARSGGGFVYQNFRDFSWVLEQLESDVSFINEFGNNGREFYEQNYRWRDVIPRFNLFLKKYLS